MSVKKRGYSLTTRIEKPLDLYQHLPFSIAVVSNLLLLNRDSALKNSANLGARELRVLLNVGSFMPITSAEIAYQSKLDTYTVSRAVKALVTEGIVAIEYKTNNSRNKYLCLTDYGVQIYQDLVNKINQRTEDLTSVLTTQEQTLLHQLLKKLEVKAESILAEHALALADIGTTLPAEQKEIIRWHKKTLRRSK
jgi:DNA-binding MarR family transcriptional regulator